VAHAYLDRAPVLLITAQLAADLQPRHTHQHLDLQALFAPITKAQYRITAGNVHHTMRAAISIAQNGRPGPVHLELSNEEAGSPATRIERIDRPSSPKDREIQSQEQEIEQALKLLSASERPIILAGLGMEPQAPYEALRELAEAGNIPVIVTPKAKGALAADHPLFAGTVGLTRFDPVEAVLDEADCVLGIGLDVVELVKPWSHPAPLIWLAPWENRDPTLPAAAEIAGSMEHYIVRLQTAAFSIDPGWGGRRLEIYRRQRLTESHPKPEPGLLRPQDVMGTLRHALPRETLFSTDVGSHKILFSLDWPAYIPNRFLVSNGLSSMGFALPAAAAAALHDRGVPVAAMMGDAGLLMQLGDLSLLHQHRLPVLVVVFKDNALDLIRSHQNRAGKPTFGTVFQAPDFVEIAGGFGIRAEQISDLPSLTAAVDRWLMVPQEPYLLEVLIDPAGYPTTPK
jgi:acetolactate synthase-1/2/3 large subunit